MASDVKTNVVLAHSRVVLQEDEASLALVRHVEGRDGELGVFTTLGRVAVVVILDHGEWEQLAVYFDIVMEQESAIRTLLSILTFYGSVRHIGIGCRKVNVII